MVQTQTHRVVLVFGALAAAVHQQVVVVGAVSTLEHQRDLLLFVNRTHYGYGDHFIYSTTSPLSYALYASVVLGMIIITTSIWICCANSNDPRRVINDSTKKETLLAPVVEYPYAKMDELLEQFHFEVKNSDVLVYDDEEQNSYTRSTCLGGSEDNDDDDDDSAAAAEPKRKQPPVVDGFYSTTLDEDIDYNEDMYLEFVPNRQNDSGCTAIQGYGKYNTGNVRVVGLVATTGEAYWYEVPYDPANNRSTGTTATTIFAYSKPHLPPVALARGKFSRKQDTGKIHFMGEWYRANGTVGGTYRLFSNKVVFPSSDRTVPSLAEESTTTKELLECSLGGSVLGRSVLGGSVMDEMDFYGDEDDHTGDDLVGPGDSSTGPQTMIVEFDNDGPGANVSEV